MSSFENNNGFRSRFLSVIQSIGGLKKCSDIVGISDEQIGKWRDGKSRPPLFAIADLCHEAEVSVDWLISGVGPKSPIGNAQGDDGILEPAANNAHQIPMQGLASCGPDGWSRLETTQFQAEAPRSIWSDKDAFAVIARGQSMQPFGLYEGFLCFCSPATEPRIGDMVCVERHGEDDQTSLTIKKLGMIGNDAVELIGYLPLEESPSSTKHGDQFQKLFWEVVHNHEIERLSVVTHIHTRPSVF